MHYLQSGIIVLFTFAILVNGQRPPRKHPRTGSAGPRRAAAAATGVQGAAVVVGGPGAAGGQGAVDPLAMLNPMGPGNPYVPGMTAALVADLMNGRPGPVPLDIAQEAMAMRAMGSTPDQISDILGDKMQIRQAVPPFMAGALGGAAGAVAGGPHYGGADPFAQTGAGPGIDLFGMSAGGAPGGGTGVGMDMYGATGAGPGLDLLGAAGAPGAAGGAGLAAGLNPMGAGRPIVPGMTAALVSDLMNGRPGPVPLDIAQEAMAMRAMGMTPDQISDTLGDKMQIRQAVPPGFMAAMLG